MKIIVTRVLNSKQITIPYPHPRYHNKSLLKQYTGGMEFLKNSQIDSLQDFKFS